MKNTNFTFEGMPISYEVVENGYNIYLDGKLWITQREDEYIPYRDVDPSADLETCCLKHIEDITRPAEIVVEAEEK